MQPSGSGRAGRWEGELVHTTRAGQPVIVISRWVLQRDEQGVPAAILELNTDITARRHAEQERQASAERLRLALAAAHMGTWDWDLLTHTQVISPEAEALFGFAPGTYHGQPDQFSAAIHPEDRGLVQQATEAALRTGVLEVEHRVVWPDGSVHWILGHGRVQRDVAGRPVRLLGTVLDITARKQAELALRREQEFSRGLIDSSTDGILAFDQACRYTAWNPAMERIAGLPKDAVLGRCAFEVFPFLRQTGEDRFFLDALAGQTVVASDRPYTVPETGRAGFFEGHYAPIRDETGAVVGGLAIVRDITERKRAEEERAQLQREQSARAEAEAALRERDQVLATVSHDLKTPLTTIRGQADLLQRRLERSGTIEPERLARGLGLIGTAARKMSTWIDELLDTARLEAGRPVELRPEPTDLVALAWQAAAEQQRTTERHRIRVETTERVLIGVWDPVRLGRVLDNLLNNAVKFSPAGGEVVVSVAREADAAGEWAVLSVRDQGLGIPAADLPHVFERFRRGTNVAGRIAGTGLGLAGACHLVQLHGGSIGVDSQEGQGSTVTVRLPLPGLMGQPQPGGTETEPPASAA